MAEIDISTATGIVTVDLDKVTLEEVSEIIAKMSVDAGVSADAVTVLYSGRLYIPFFITGDFSRYSQL